MQSEADLPVIPIQPCRHGDSVALLVHSTPPHRQGYTELMTCRCCDPLCTVWSDDDPPDISIPLCRQSEADPPDLSIPLCRQSGTDPPDLSIPLCRQSGADPPDLSIPLCRQSEAIHQTSPFLSADSLELIHQTSPFLSAGTSTVHPQRFTSHVHTDGSTHS